MKPQSSTPTSSSEQLRVHFVGDTEKGGSDSDQETGTGKPQHHAAAADGEQKKKGFWPREICCCLPPIAKVWIPGTCQVIQDPTHFILVIGLIGGLILLIEDVVIMMDMKNWANLMFWLIFILTCFTTLPNIMYLTKILGTYDEQIQVKEAAIADRKKELAQSYESLISSIDELLGRAAESSATMAERGFESKRRDFQRFLEHSETRYKNLATSEKDAEAMLTQFRCFVQRWLTVFKECSVDPIKNPKIIITEEELARCKTIGEVASKTVDKLKSSVGEVRFISSKQDEEKKFIRGCRKEVRRLTMDPRRMQLDRGDSGSSSAMSEIELMPTNSRLGLRDDGNDPENNSGKRLQPNGGTSERMLQASGGAQRWFFGWLACGSFGCGPEKGTSADGYPWKFHMKVFQVLILSREHLFLLMGTIALVPLILLILTDHMYQGLIPALLYLMCLILVLMRFEQIDVVQRLEREVIQLQEQSDSIRDRREQMVNFWNDMQQLTDLWVHRTVPRLDLLKEVQGHLEFSAPEDHLAFMAAANQRLEDLENNLPVLEFWRGDGDLSEESKKAFSEWILHLCQEDNLPMMLQKLSAGVENELPRLTAPMGSVPHS